MNNCAQTFLRCYVSTALYYSVASTPFHGKPPNEISRLAGAPGSSAHGGRFNKESWRDQAQVLAAAGFQVLAIDFRGFGRSRGPAQADFDNVPFHNDVLAAVRYLKTQGAKTVSVVGASFGGGAAGDTSIKSLPDEIDRIVFLGAAPNLPAEKLKSRALFIVARDDANHAGP